MTTAPIVCTWTDDGSFKPLPRFAKAADAAFVVGAQYHVEAQEPRSMKSHNFYFAQLNEYWLNLPEAIAVDFPTVETLRYRALIMSGFANSRQFIASSKAEAVRLAAFMRGSACYSIIAVKECVVTELTPQSQSLKAMGKDEFNRSKQAVLDYCAALVGAKANGIAA